MDYTCMRVPELKAEARRLGIPRAYAMRKQELIDAIILHNQQEEGVVEVANPVYFRYTTDENIMNQRLRRTIMIELEYANMIFQQQIEDAVTASMNEMTLSNARGKENLSLDSILCNAEEDCSICLDKIVVGEKQCKLSCDHTFHTECVKEWSKINASCPVCRREI